MAVYERVLKKGDLNRLVKDFTNRTHYSKSIQEILGVKQMFFRDYDDVKGFEIMNKLNSDREKITVHELTLYLKYKNALIKATELKIKGKDRKLFTVDGNILKKDRNRTVLEKFTLDHGKLTSHTTIDHPRNENLEIPEYLEIPYQTNDTTIRNSPVPCFNWDGSGTCCKFRYNANPLNPVVTYNWCGANCGGGCGSSPSTVNALDRCCKNHDCCYVRNSDYPARCTCDQSLINCANGTDEAGTSRVVTAFKAKQLYFGC